MHRMLRKLSLMLMGFITAALFMGYGMLQGQAVPPLSPPNPAAIGQTSGQTSGQTTAAPAVLPPLPYDYAALEPYIDAATMKLHHDKHHGGYVKGLNKALKEYPDLQKQSVEWLAVNLSQVPEPIRMKVRNFGGGHLNHIMYWQIMKPKGGGAPTGALAAAINQTFGGFDQFKKAFEKMGTEHFGSGWIWLVRDRAGQLKLISTPNQDNPVMTDSTIYPILGNDVWEHAYYLKHQNRRAEYLEGWWNVVNWPEVNRRYEQAVATQK